MNTSKTTKNLEQVHIYYDLKEQLEETFMDSYDQLNGESNFVQITNEDYVYIDSTVNLEQAKLIVSFLESIEALRLQWKDVMDERRLHPDVKWLYEIGF